MIANTTATTDDNPAKLPTHHIAGPRKSLMDPSTSISVPQEQQQQQQPQLFKQPSFQQQLSGTTSQVPTQQIVLGSGVISNQQQQQQSQYQKRRTRSKRLKSRSLLLVEDTKQQSVEEEEQEEGTTGEAYIEANTPPQQSQVHHQGRTRNHTKAITTIMTPQFKDNDDRIAHHQTLQRTTTEQLQSKSARHLDISNDDDSQYGPIAFHMQESILVAGSGTESCIQANRKAVKELRPPQNLGDDVKSSSHHDELVGCDFTMIDSDGRLGEPAALGSSPPNLNEEFGTGGSPRLQYQESINDRDEEESEKISPKQQSNDMRVHLQNVGAGTFLAKLKTRRRSKSKTDSEAPGSPMRDTIQSASAIVTGHGLGQGPYRTLNVKAANFVDQHQESDHQKNNIRQSKTLLSGGTGLISGSRNQQSQFHKSNDAYWEKAKVRPKLVEDTAQSESAQIKTGAGATKQSENSYTSSSKKCQMCNRDIGCTGQMCLKTNGSSTRNPNTNQSSAAKKTLSQKLSSQLQSPASQALNQVNKRSLLRHQQKQNHLAGSLKSPPVITLNLGGGAGAGTGSSLAVVPSNVVSLPKTPERQSLTFNLHPTAGASSSASETMVQINALQSYNGGDSSSAHRQSATQGNQHHQSPSTLQFSINNAQVKHSPIPSPRTSPYRTTHHNVSYSHHQAPSERNLSSSPRVTMAQSQQQLAQISEDRQRGKSTTSDRRKQSPVHHHSNTEERVHRHQNVQHSFQQASPNSNNGHQLHFLNNQSTHQQSVDSQDAGAALSGNSVLLNSNLEALIKYIASQQQLATQPNQGSPSHNLNAHYNQSLDASLLGAYQPPLQLDSSTLNATGSILQRQELLLDKAVNEYNKLLTRYNDLLAKHQAERQLMQSQVLLIQSKDDAMKAMNQRVVELERRVATAGKEMAAFKVKAQEEKEQLFAEARAHERAKQQMSTMFAQLQDSEKNLKMRNAQVQLEFNEMEGMVKSLKEQQLRLETEKKYIEMESQRKHRHQSNDAFTEDVIKVLRQENADLRARLDEGIAKQAKQLTQLGFAAGQSFSMPRKDSFSSQMHLPNIIHEDYLGSGNHMGHNALSPAGGYRRGGEQAMMSEAQAMAQPIEKFYATQQSPSSHHPGIQSQGPYMFQTAFSNHSRGKPSNVPLLNLRQINLVQDQQQDQSRYLSPHAGNTNMFYNTTPAAITISNQSYGIMGNQQQQPYQQQQQMSSHRSTSYQRMTSPIAFDRKLQQNDSSSMNSVLSWPNNANNNGQKSHSRARTQQQSQFNVVGGAGGYDEMPPAGMPSYQQALNQNKVVFNVYNTAAGGSQMQ